MCKETFLRLPEEKRNRILDAAWEEFTSVSFTKASINRIIRRAEIPRGSFYQYFDDKDDLFHYLMKEVREQFADGYRRLLDDAHGDMFRSAIMGYDRFLSERRHGRLFPAADRCMKLIRINPGMDLEALGRNNRPDKREVMRDFLERMNLAPFRRRDEIFLRQVCCMVGACLVGAIMDALINPEQEAEDRRELLEALEILRRGSYTEAALTDVANGYPEAPDENGYPETPENIGKGDAE